MKKLQIENDFIGFLETSSGQTEFYHFKDALKALIDIWEDYEHLIAKYPKSIWGIGYRADDERWISVFKISSAMIRKLKKENLW